MSPMRTPSCVSACEPVECRSVEVVKKPSSSRCVCAIPSAVAATSSALWAVLQPGGGAPDKLIKIDPSTGQTIASADYAWGIGSITTSPTAVWVAARRRARIQRVDPRNGQVQKTIQVGRSRSEDIAYRSGALWLATPDDDTVYKVTTATGDAIPISVGQQPRQLAAGKDTIYVTNYSSSDLYTIDERTSRVLGDPLRLSVNPFSLALDRARDTLWVGSVPENKLSRVVTGRGG
jgi:hypothetical protein